MSVYHLSSVIMPNESKLTKPLLELPEHILFNYKYHRTHWYQIPLQSYHLHHSSCASWWKRYYYQNACMTCWPKKKKYHPFESQSTLRLKDAEERTKKKSNSNLPFNQKYLFTIFSSLPLKRKFNLVEKSVKPYLYTKFNVWPLLAILHWKGK